MSVKDRELQDQSFADSRTLEKLLEISQSLISVRDLELLLQGIAEAAGDVLGADVIVLYEYQEETNDVKVPPVIWGDIEYPEVLREISRVRPHKKSAVFKMLERAEPFYASNAREDWAQLIEEWPQEEGESGNFVYREGIVSSAAVRLTVDGERVGVLFVNYRTRHAFPDEERRIIEFFAAQAAIAIRNADLFVKEQRRTAAMELLSKVSATISSTLDPRESLVLIAQGAVQLTMTDAASVIHLIDKDKQAISHSYEFPEGFGHLPSRFSEKMGLTWDVFNTKKIVEIRNVPRSKRVSLSLAQSGVKSLIGVPLKLRERVIGVLFVNTLEQHEFAAHEKATLTTLAEQAAIAIQNARRLQQEQTLRRQAETLREVSAAISSPLELEEVAKRILDELGKVVEYRKASMQLIRGDARTMLARRGFDEEAVDKWLLRPISEDRLISRIVESKKPLILSEPSEDDDWEVYPETADIKSWVGLPLVYGEETVGLLTLDHDESGFYTQVIEDLLTSFAAQAAIAIEKARLFGDAERRIRDLEIVNHVAQIISTKLDIQSLLETIVSQIANRLNCTHCTIFFLQKEKGELLLVPQETHGVRREQILTRRFKPGKGLAGKVFQEGKSRLLKDARKDPDFSPAREAQNRPRSMLVAPVKVGERTIGVISADQDEYGWFSENDLRLVDALARQAGIAIERARGLALLQDVGNQIISAPELNDTLRRIVVGAIELTRTTSGTIYLISEDGTSVTKRFLYPPGFDHPPPRVGRAEGLTRQVLETGKALILPDIRLEERINPALYDIGIRSMIAVPLKLEGRVIGVLYLNDSNLREFTETEVSLLTTLASQAAIAIKNADLLEQERQRAEAMGLLQRISGRISATLDVDGTLALIMEGAMQLIGTESGVIHLVDESQPGGISSYELPQDFGHLSPRFSEEKGMTWTIVSTEQMLAVPDISKDVRVNPDMVKKGVKAIIGVPLNVERETIGALFLNDTEPREFSEYEKNLLSTLADQAAIAIKNAHLYAEERRKAEQLGRLDQVAEAMTRVAWEEFSLERVLRTILESIDTVLGKETTSCISLYDQDQKGFGRRVASGPLRDHLLQHPPRCNGTGAHVVRTKQALFVDDVSSTSLDHANIRKETTTQGVKSFAMLPLTIGENVVGTLFINLLNPYRFSEEPRILLDTFADQAAIAIENARLYEQLDRKIANLQTVNEVGQQLTASIRLSEPEIVELIYDQASQVMDTDNMYIALYDEVTDTVSFALAFLDGWPVDVATAKGWQPRSGGQGRTEWIIHHRKPLASYTEAESKAWYADPEHQEYIGQPFASWVGVPMIASDKVLGVIATYHADKEYIYDDDDLQVLSLMASQAAIALNNARLVRSLQESILENTRLVRQLEKRIDEINAYRELAEEFTSVM